MGDMYRSLMEILGHKRIVEFCKFATCTCARDYFDRLARLAAFGYDGGIYGRYSAHESTS
jgi:hypothetical protein